MADLMNEDIDLRAQGFELYAAAEAIKTISEALEAVLPRLPRGNAAGAHLVEARAFLASASDGVDQAHASLRVALHTVPSLHRALGAVS